MPTNRPAHVRHAVEVMLPATRAAASEARRATMALADVPAESADDVLLVVSELVTNALKHAGRSPGEVVSFQLERRRDRLRIAVCDAGPGFDPAQAIAASDGYGLRIVDTLASSWDVDPATGTVWAEFDLREAH